MKDTKCNHKPEHRDPDMRVDEGPMLCKHCDGYLCFGEDGRGELMHVRDLPKTEDGGETNRGVVPSQAWTLNVDVYAYTVPAKEPKKRWRLRWPLYRSER